MALKFLNKKGWHTGSLRNIENVWKAEQKHADEQKKLEEIRHQYQAEREAQELRQLQEAAGITPRQERLEFLYDSGLSTGKGTAEEYLLGKPVEEEKLESEFSKLAETPGSLFESKEEKPPSANEVWRKLHSDPLFLIRQQEQEARAKIRSNPVKMQMIQKEVEEKSKRKDEKARLKEERKRQRKEEKRKRKDARKRGKDTDDSYSESEEDERPKQIASKEYVKDLDRREPKEDRREEVRAGQRGGRDTYSQEAEMSKYEYGKDRNEGGEGRGRYIHSHRKKGGDDYDGARDSFSRQEKGWRGGEKDNGEPSSRNGGGEAVWDRSRSVRERERETYSRKDEQRKPEQFHSESDEETRKGGKKRRHYSSDSEEDLVKNGSHQEWDNNQNRDRKRHGGLDERRQERGNRVTENDIGLEGKRRYVRNDSQQTRRVEDDFHRERFDKSGERGDRRGEEGEEKLDKSSTGRHSDEDRTFRKHTRPDFTGFDGSVKDKRKQPTQRKEEDVTQEGARYLEVESGKARPSAPGIERRECSEEKLAEVIKKSGVLPKVEQISERNGRHDRVGNRGREGEGNQKLDDESLQRRRRHDSPDPESDEGEGRSDKKSFQDRNLGYNSTQDGKKSRQEDSTNSGGDIPVDQSEHDRDEVDNGRRQTDRSGGEIEGGVEYGLSVPRGAVRSEGTASALAIAKAKSASNVAPRLPPRPKYRPGQMSEEERSRRLREMQMDAEVHEDQRWKRIKTAEENDAAEEQRGSIKGRENFLEETNKAVYGAGKGGSASIEESVRRRKHFQQKGGGEGSAFRR